MAGQRKGRTTPYQRLVASQREWLAKNERMMWTEPRAVLALWLRDRKGSFPTGDVGPYASWLAISGAVLVVDGDARGWEPIHDSCVLDASLARSRLRNGSEVAAPKLCAPLAGLVDVGDAPRARQFRDDILRARASGVDCGWSWTAFADLILFLASRLDGAAFTFCPRYEEAPSLCLRRIAAAWDDDTALTPALVEASDYHLARAQSTHVSAEFALRAYPIFAAEMGAVRAIRAMEGRAALEIDHELARSPLAFPPPQPQIAIKDSLVMEVVAFLDAAPGKR